MNGLNGIQTLHAVKLSRQKREKLFKRLPMVENNVKDHRLKRKSFNYQHVVTRAEYNVITGCAVMIINIFIMAGFDYQQYLNILYLALQIMHLYIM